MPPINFTLPQIGKMPYSYENFAKAKIFLFDKWCEMAVVRQRVKPVDLSRSCKYGSLFVQNVFGGSIRGHYEHQYNFIEGRLVDLSHDALDVGRMRHPYLHEKLYFEIPEVQAALAQCAPRADQWASEFVAHHKRESAAGH
ncbi:hypothetical protein MIZ03_3979 [Rhodoferax lithotrophicus]|jgi:hypothetical protein|uniref:Transcriptional regulator n=1 Tax=Rhodoferax lithotrophicus TaxID=2798804 RepID=A0ABN6DAL1_9BURK|nr:hypothetical protein [Rhodoferax sp. MIZ03]BCO29067.1 hypothetical protein MIZ03_3979 [Rhodoferax sp. MIZ03]